ncbi:MAG: phosphoenolpyruvate--protein phosphotransferase [Deltaproteobacteria bacterium]|nr:phosphoenolpyruvate--protein phosphotransferase [Deltaproteobacteria bacterium]MBW1938973.1 phosphoenolpyruvate--protein phosphotransferase [Deltaproteobacteria bacterium]
MMPEKKCDSVVLKGIGASPGVVVGPAFLLDYHKVKILKRQIEKSEIDQEKQRFENAVSEAENQIKQLIAEIPEEFREHSGIFETHLLMLKDRMVYDRTLRLISEKKINAEWALNNALDHVRELFEQVKDQYIRERFEDIKYAVRRVQKLLSGSPSVDFSQMESPVILVAHDLSPADTVQMAKEKILAFVTDMGSRTSHTVILSRSLGLPAVVGLENATSSILSGETLIVDGLCGDVVVNPEDDLLRHYREKQEDYIQYRLDVIQYSNLPAETQDGFRFKIKANIEFLEEISTVISNGAEGIGLYRTEVLYLAHKELPIEEELFLAYKEVVERISPFSTTIRTLDIGGDKFLSSVSQDDEINPALGLRAIRLCLKESNLFRTQLRAILRASAYGDVRILFPLVSGRSEIMQVKEHLEKTKDDLRREKIPFNGDIKIGIMIEVPSAVLLADVLAKEVDFFSIGTNDLIQYSLAIDRGNECVAHLYEPLHPGVLRMIYRTIEAAHEAGIEAAVCGEMAGEPMYLPVLIGMGLDELSMNALDIPKIKRMIRVSNQDQCSALVRNLLECSTAQEIRGLLLDFLTPNFPGEFDLSHGLYPDFAGRDAILGPLMTEMKKSLE